MEKSILELMGGSYTLGADGMYHPDLRVPKEEPAHYGKYGRIHMAFLQKHRRGMYLELLLAGNLTAYLNEIDNAAREQAELLIR